MTPPTVAETSKPADTAKLEEAPKATIPEPSNTQAKADEAAKVPSDVDSEGGEKPGERKHHKGLDLGELKLGDLGLDKVLTRTKSGKCKLNLPFVKVVIDCKQD